MSIRMVVFVSCDAPDCEARTRATAIGIMAGPAPLGGAVTFRDVEFPPNELGQPSDWVHNGTEDYCPTHRRGF